MGNDYFSILGNPGLGDPSPMLVDLTELGPPPPVPNFGHIGGGPTVNAQGQQLVSVPDPANFNRLIWVPAKQNAGGDLVPIDPRISTRLTNTGAKKPGASMSNQEMYMLAGGAVLLVVLLAGHHKGR